MGKSEEKKPDVLNLDLLSFVSHELKSPLTVLKLNTELLKKYVRPDQYPLINAMTEEIHWMTKLIQDVLDLRVADNKASLSMNWHRWNKIVYALERTLKTFMKSLDIKLNIHWIDKDVEIYMDPLYIRQVLLNAIMNAIEHSPQQGQIDLVWEGDAQKEGLSIYIKDQGSGISSLDREKIFKPFYKGRQKSTQVFRNSGLGLVFVKKIVQFHGGSVQAMNRQEGGFILKVDLPKAHWISSSVA